jgi:hypothetical protein
LNHLCAYLETYKRSIKPGVFLLRQVEREWRRKEREAAMAKARKAEELRIAREQQILDRRKCQALEIQREKEETERIARVNREEMEKQKLEEQRRLCVRGFFLEKKKVAVSVESY